MPLRCPAQPEGSAAVPPAAVAVEGHRGEPPSKKVTNK